MEHLFTIGVNMKGKQIVCKCEVLDKLDPSQNEHGYDCVIKSGGISIKSHRNTLYATRKAALESLK